MKHLGTKRHHDKWLRPTENYEVAGCFALTELGHGSNVRGPFLLTTGACCGPESQVEEEW